MESLFSHHYLKKNRYLYESLTSLNLKKLCLLIMALTFRGLLSGNCFQTSIYRFPTKQDFYVLPVLGGGNAFFVIRDLAFVIRENALISYQP